MSLFMHVLHFFFVKNPFAAWKELWSRTVVLYTEMEKNAEVRQYFLLFYHNHRIMGNHRIIQWVSELGFGCGNNALGPYRVPGAQT